MFYNSVKTLTSMLQLSWVVAQDILEEWAAGGRNHFVSLDLIIITSKSHIEEIFIITNATLMVFLKSFTDVSACLRENV